MALPIPPNTTFEVELGGGSAVFVGPYRGFFRAIGYGKSIEMGESEVSQSWRFTHLLDCELSVDIRDDYDRGTVPGTAPDYRVWVPDRNGVNYDIAFVARIDRGNALDRKRVYLLRDAVSWPSEL